MTNYSYPNAQCLAIETRTHRSRAPSSTPSGGGCASLWDSRREESQSQAKAIIRLTLNLTKSITQQPTKYCRAGRSGRITYRHARISIRHRAPPESQLFAEQERAGRITYRRARISIRQSSAFRKPSLVEQERAGRITYRHAISILSPIEYPRKPEDGRSINL